MSRPGPKPNNDPIISERLDLIEQLLRNLLGDTTDDTATSLLRDLDRLKQRQQAHACPVCSKFYSDSKGLRRHIMSMGDKSHAEIAGQIRMLDCQWCSRRYTKREQVTKHERICFRRVGARVAEAEAEAVAEEGEEEQEEEVVVMEEPAVRSRVVYQLPSIVTNPASANGAYFSKADLDMMDI